MVAIVLHGDKIIAEGAAGIRKSGAKERVTIDDPFHLGSNTKSMTATLAGLLVDEGRLERSATIGDLFGDEKTRMDPAWRSVTLQQVLAHRAGFPANYPAELRQKHRTSERPLPEQRREIVADLLSHPPEYPPGSKMLYSNTGFILVGAALEKITGRAWEDLMRERLFKPLGITTGGFGAPGTPGKVDAPWGHGGRQAEPWQGDNLPALGPAGTVHMAIRDWAKFVTLHLRGDPRNPQRDAKLLKPETFEWLHTPAPDETYFAGWVFEQRPAFKGSRTSDSGKVFWHNGSNTAWYAIMVLAPEVDHAVLFAGNRMDPDTVKAFNDGSRALLRFYLEAGAKTKQSEAPAK